MLFATVLKFLKPVSSTSPIGMSQFCKGDTCFLCLIENVSQAVSQGVCLKDIGILFEKDFCTL